MAGLLADGYPRNGRPCREMDQNMSFDVSYIFCGVPNASRWLVQPWLAAKTFGPSCAAAMHTLPPKCNSNQPSTRVHLFFSAEPKMRLSFPFVHKCCAR